MRTARFEHRAFIHLSQSLSCSSQAVQQALFDGLALYTAREIDEEVLCCDRFLKRIESEVFENRLGSVYPPGTQVRTVPGMLLF